MKTNNEMTSDTTLDENTYQVIITNLVWSKESTRVYRSKYDAKKSIPSQMFDFIVPAEKIKKFSKNMKTFNDELETYVYNTLTSKFGRELYSCQIWLPLFENNIVD